MAHAGCAVPPENCILNELLVLPCFFPLVIASCRMRAVVQARSMQQADRGCRPARNGTGDMEAMAGIPVAFRVFIFIAVTFTGGAFGAFAGLVYSQHHWWVGMIVGAASGFFLARLYLEVLARISLDLHKCVQWLLGTLTAVGCGIVCTLLVHGVMILVTHGSSILANELPVPVYGIVTIGVIMGASAGLIVGGICSLVFVSMS